MTKVKICGITNVEDAHVAVAAGADLLGFILYPKSPRYVAPLRIREIVATLWESCQPGVIPRFVGVFVNAEVDFVTDTLAQTGLDFAQLHGDEPPEWVAALSGRGYKALRPTGLEDALAGADLFGSCGPASGPRLLIDAFDPSAYGGTGHKADWHAAAAVARRCPGLLLAGGLTPENVAAAVQAVQPWGVDVSSGVEAAPGRKDPDLVRAFVADAKNAA